MKRNLKIAAGFLLSALLLAWLFHGTQWKQVGAELRRVDLGWLAASQAFLWLLIFTRIERWKPIVRAGGPATYRTLFSATQIGFLANWILPGRAGEVVRAGLLTRFGGFPLTQSLALVALDRMTDLVGLVFVLLVALTAYHPVQDIVLPAELFTRPIPATLVRSGAIATSVVLFALAGMLALLFVNQRLVSRIAGAVTGAVSHKLQQRVHRMLGHFAAGLTVFGSAPKMAYSILLSLGTWLGYVAAMACIFRAFSIECPWYTSFLVQAVLSVAVSLPAAPGFLGQFHAGVVASLLMAAPAVDISVAKAAAILMHISFLVPVAATGSYALIREHMALFEIGQAELATAKLSDDSETPAEGSGPG
ncbi:MAG: flippase-like domain-containing protein [Candidatus Hydrogenedentes bacterium]|nr:flippase-like domain-containing protein [Candidatus Hydrogenedentota bacterium]